MATWKKVLVSGSAIEVANITASNVPAGTGGDFLIIDSVGRISKTGSAGSGGIFVNQGTYYNTKNTLQISGSTLQTPPTTTSVTASQGAARYAFIVSESAHFYNHNVGYPTSNAWGNNLEGSYFNNFDANTDVSEILRFVAGLLSSSAASPSPNTRTFLAVAGSSGDTLTGLINGRVPQNSTDPIITYLNGKGFVTEGRRLFQDASPAIGTIYKSSGFYREFASTAGGDTSVSSSADVNLFGLGSLSSGNATPFYVSGALSFKFIDNNSNNITATSQSQHLLSQTSFGTSNGLTLGKINTNNPSVIPPSYQDGKFAGILSNVAKLYNGGITFNTKEAVGYYEITGSIGIATGSSTYTNATPSSIRIFYADTDTLNSNLTTQNITATTTSASLTLTSGSLSGAPYVRTSTYRIRTEYSGLFNPLYYYSTNNASIASLEEASTGGIYDLLTISSELGGSNFSQINGTTGRVNTSNTVYSTTGTIRTTSDIPHQSDLIKLSGSITFNAGASGTTNIGATTTLSPTTFTIDSRAVNRSSVTTDIIETPISVHYPGEFGQPVSSGSMAYFGFPTVLTETATSETFKDEANRIQLNNNVTTFTGNAWDSGSRLGDNDLQVKPGYLVDPGGTRRYWYPSNYGNTFKYYIRKFRRTTNIASFTLNLGQTLVAWDDTTTSNGVSVGLIFESAISGSHGLTTTRIYDPYHAAGDRSITFSGGTSGTNPFSSNLDYFGINSNISSTTYTISVARPLGVYMDGSNEDSFYVIIRYKGEPTTTVTSIAVSAGS